MDAILFYVCAAIAVASALVVIGQRSPMYSAFALIVTLCSLSVIFALLFVFIWLRGTLPRVRYDQLMHFGWKVLIPVAAVWILITATGVALFPGMFPVASR